MTQLLDASIQTNILQAADQLQAGELVVYPTDTVYGVGVSAFSDEALRRLYHAKQRPFDKAIPVLLADPDDILRIADHLPDYTKPLIEAFWPGPLTLIVPKRADLPPTLSPNDGVAVRIPSHPIARAFIRACGGAVATTSANLSGQPPAQTGAEALAQLAGQVAVILEDGRSPHAIASTIIDCRTDNMTIVRQGPITENELQPYL